MKNALEGIIKGLFTAAVMLIFAAALSVVACSNSETCTANTSEMYYDGTYADIFTGAHFLAGFVVAIDNAE
tara:strand:- start:301 stop:513 length:213 start_codon:yes stop_codon:yes gene_type:complete